MIKSNRNEVFLEGNIHQLTREFCNIARAISTAIAKREPELVKPFPERVQVMTFMQICTKLIMDEYDQTVIEDGGHFVIDKRNMDMLLRAAEEIKKKKDDNEE